MDNYLNLLPEELIDIILDEDFDFLQLNAINEMVEHDIYKIVTIKRFKIFNNYRNIKGINWDNLFHQILFIENKDYNLSLIDIIIYADIGAEISELLKVYFIKPDLEKDEESIVSIVGIAINYGLLNRISIIIRQKLTKNIKREIIGNLLYSEHIEAFKMYLKDFEYDYIFYKTHHSYVSHMYYCARSLLYENKITREGFGKYGSNLKTQLNVRHVSCEIKVIKNKEEIKWCNFCFSMFDEFIIDKNLNMLYRINKINNNIIYVSDLTKEDIELGKEKGYSLK